MAAADISDRVRRIGVLLAVAALGMVVGGFLAGGFSSTTGPRAAEAVGPDVGDIRLSATVAGPSRKVEGVGVGFSANEAGAIAAATNLILTLEQAAATDRNSAIRTYEILAADGAQSTLAADMADTWDALHGSIASNGPNRSTLFLRTVPVGHDLLRFSDGRATVEVWTLTMVAANGMREPIASWETATIEVVWENDDWKVWSANSRNGPTPAWAAGETVPLDGFMASVAELEGYRYVTD